MAGRGSPRAPAPRPTPVPGQERVASAGVVPMEDVADETGDEQGVPLFRGDPVEPSSLGEDQRAGIAFPGGGEEGEESPGAVGVGASQNAVSSSAVSPASSWSSRTMVSRRVSSPSQPPPSTPQWPGQAMPGTSSRRCIRYRPAPLVMMATGPRGRRHAGDISAGPWSPARTGLGVWPGTPPGGPPPPRWPGGRSTRWWGPRR